MTSTAAEVLLTQHQLSAITAPRAIALIGASGDPKRLTSRPQRFLQQHEFCGNIIPINPARAVVLERRSYPSVADVDGPIDLAYILLGTDHVETQLTACVHAGVAAVAVLADGYAERGADGLARQKRLVEIANEAGLALIGPNSMGLADTRSRAICTTNAAFAVNDIRQGRTAVLSQSGSLIGTILSRGQALGAAYATFISTGNEAQLTVGDFGEALVDDPTIDSFVLFLETMRAPDRFARFAAAAKSAGKPIVAYQVGASDEGRALAMSHTGAMVTGPGALSAFLDAHGVSEVKTFDALFEAPRALLAARRRHDLPARPPKDRGALVVTTTGGGGAIMVDQLGLRGVPLCSPSDATRAELANAGIHHGGGPLIDVTLAGANQETMTRVIETLVTADEVGLLITAIGSSAQFNPELAVRPVIEAAKRDATAAAPVFAFPLPHAPESHALFAEAGIASFRTPESAADAARHVLKSARSAMRTSRSDEIGATVELKTTERRVAALPSGMCNERQSGDILRALGVNLARSVFVKAGDDLADAIRDWTGHWPVVVKLVSRDIAHKSD
ncbi:MAG: CoA-binding protein, partial [Pseudomonadota bacterium]